MSDFILSESLLDNCARRAGDYDRENRFFFEDLEDLRAAKYLMAAVPREFGGLGLTLVQICQEQRRLARRSAPTALAVNMHLGATGHAADLWRKGHSSLAWMLEEAARGAIFAYGYSESGNDLEGLYATTRAERADGGWRFYGHRHFGSLSPVWNWFNTYGVDTSDPNDAKMVFAAISRDSSGYRIVENWDTLGMRATQSHDTILEGVFVPDRYVQRIGKPGFAGADDFLLTLFGWFQPLFGNVYVGLAERARDLAVERVKKKSSVAMSRSMAYHPGVQHNVAQIFYELEAMIAQVERVADDWASNVDHGHIWPAKLVAAKHRCVDGAVKVVDLALEVSGGRGMFRGDELERLYRDARCGRFHPANPMVVYEVMGKCTLDVLADDGLRWG